MQLTDKINNVLKRRRKQLPLVENEYDMWNKLKNELDNLESDLIDLVNYKKSPDEIKDIYENFKNQNIRNLVNSSINELEKVRNRMQRSTVNIGVSGQARVGKSTLLQTIAGLDDEQVPTGSGIPVTAVRSRIFHSSIDQRAIIKFHDYKSFRENILKPYHNELELGNLPRTIEEFKKYNYSVSDDIYNELSNPKQVLYRRLRQMQQALPSYKKYMTGGEQEVSLQGLRKFIAYPTKEQKKLSDCPREYLAVQDVKIECKFPQLNAHKIGLIDLPGLGELSAGAEEHHVHGLQNDVDFVLFIKRPVEGMAYWRKEDGKALEVLDEARGAIKRRGDFVTIVSNEGGATEDIVDSMLGDILGKVNSGVPDKNYKILKTDVKNKKAVYERLVNPVLEHLADNLAKMDREIFDFANEEIKKNSDRIKKTVEDITQRIKNSFPPSQSSEESLFDLTKDLHENIAVELRNVVSCLFDNARSDDEDDEYIKAVEDAENDVMSWVENGLGIGDKEDWINKADRRMKLKAGIAGFAEDEFNRIRVYISNQYSILDNYFNKKVSELWEQTGTILKTQMGNTLTDSKSNMILQDFSKLLEKSGEECPNLLKAVKDILDLDIKYRTHLHPRIRKCLDMLKFTLYSKELNLGDTETGPRELYVFLINKAIQAANEIKKALFKEADFTPKVIHAACEQFDDCLIRSGNSEKEFGRFARSYKNEIWPDIFKEMDIKNAYIAKVNKTSNSITNIIEKLGE